MGSRPKALPKSKSNTRISVMTGMLSSSPSKTSESTRLVYQHYKQYQQQNQRQQQNALHGGALGGNVPGSVARNPAAGNESIADGGRYGGYESLQPPSNPVEDCLRSGVAGLGWCLVSWWLGVLILIFEYARRWGAHKGSDSYRESGPPWLIFTPFWVGDVLALVVLARIIAKMASVKFTSPARTRIARRDFRERSRSTGNIPDLACHGSSHGAGSGRGNSSSLTTVTLDYFPLLQRVVTTSVAAGLLLVILSTEQVLVCLLWGREAGASGVPPTLAIATPLLVLEVLFLLKVALIRTQGWLSGITWTLLLLLTLLVAFRSDPEPSHELPRALRDYPWLECLTPLWVLDLLYAGVAAYVTANACAERFVMTPTQGLCFVLFVSALVGSTLAEILLTGDHRLHKINDRIPRVEYLRMDLPLILIVASLTVFCLAVFLSANHYVSKLIDTHGYEDPLPLCETPSGWEWSGTGKAALGLLGDVSLRAEKKVGLPGGLSGTKSSAVSSNTDKNAVEADFTHRFYQRTDSGQYVDIYESLA